jgi:exodeoxyribonuclease V gamma subunit
MFILHVSNRTENLLEHLRRVVDVAPLSDPFAKETLMIQSRGMERWLAQQLAAHFKVWANYEFLFPEAFFAAIAERIDSRLNAEGFARNRVLWRLESLLRNADADVYRPLHHYLDGNSGAIKRYQLARQLAQLFDQYQILRPDMLAAWQNGRAATDASEEPWQRALWLELLEQIGARHRGLLWLEAVDKLRAVPEGALAGQLPERVSLFGLNAMPPLFLHFLQGVARHTQVHLYLLNPAQNYWADLDSKRQAARRQIKSSAEANAVPMGSADNTAGLKNDGANVGANSFAPERHGSNEFDPAVEQLALRSTALGLIEGHPLLAALGQQGREFQQLLLEEAEFALELESYEQDGAPSNLQQLQNDILANRVGAVKLRNDGSIAIHACHSRMREVEVLRDQLLHALENDRRLELRDIVVMAPDIQQYAPFVAAVFADIQHAVADRSLRISNALLDAFVGFLRLAQSRFGWQEVLDLLQQPSVYGSFDLSETDLQWLSRWIEDTRIRWGRSAEHKQQLGLPPQPENTWLAGLQRLLMGYATGDDSEFALGILPYKHLEGSAAQALGGLHDFLQLLFAAADELAVPRPLRDWGETLHRYAGTLFAGTAADAVERRQLQELLNELDGDLGNLHRDPVTLEVLLAWLEDALDEQITASGFLRGQLTFCSMLPMRAIPFKIIALLGLNDGEFPKIDRPPGFDLLAKHYRKGDRSRRADDRYQFLEILLSARQRLLITYTGQSLRDNRSIPPSVVVDELLEVLQASYGLTDLVVKHPLQPFGPRYFNGAEPLFSYSAEHCAAARSLARNAVPLSVPNAEPPPPWWQGEIPATDEDSIAIDDLLAFYRHPQKYFLQRKLALYLAGPEAAAEECEPFALAGLEAYDLEQQWITAELAGEAPELAKWQAQGRWPAGALGEIERRRREPALRQFAAAVAAKAVGAALPERLIDLHVGRYRLVGKLSNLYARGSLFYRFSPLKGKDLLQAWLHHLIVNRLQAQYTYLLAADADLLLPPELGGSDILTGLLDIYRLGQTRPDVFFTEAALAYLRQAQALQNGGKSAKSALDAALESLQKSLEAGYDEDMALALRGRESAAPLLGAAFEEACRTLLLPMWEAVH